MRNMLSLLSWWNIVFLVPSVIGQIRYLLSECLHFRPRLQFLKKKEGNFYKLWILDVGYCWPLLKCQDGERQPHHRVRFKWRPQIQTQIQDLDVAFGFNPVPSHIHLM